VPISSARADREQADRALLERVLKVMERTEERLARLETLIEDSSAVGRA
jgi:hypothetical protein